MIKKILLAWIGNADLKSSVGDQKGLGPIGQAVKDLEFTHVYLLSDHKEKIGKDFCKWLGGSTKAEIKLLQKNLSGPTQFGEIYEAALDAVNEIKKDLGADTKITYHLSPGTPAMAAIWILLAKTSHPADLIESSIEHGVKKVSFPFDISADYLPSLSRQDNERIVQLAQGLPPESPEFQEIIHRCQVMNRVVAQARKIAIHDVPVLIQGESGTGKELLARAIHASSPRKGGPFVAVNCGAIPRELFESEFFGHQKGSFTGATKDKIGYLERAKNGSLFLDEIGELPLDMQVKLLRSLQDGTIQKIGSTESIKIDFRAVAATNRNLLQNVSEGKFREDLFHRIAVGVLHLPPLRERKGDLDLLIDHLIERINRDGEKISGWEHKNISAGARNLIHQHPWPGNIRELHNTLSRASIWAAGATLKTEDIQEALLPIAAAGNGREQILNRNLGGDFTIQDVLKAVARHYLKKALTESRGNKTLAAKLVGLPNYQTFSNWMEKYEVET